MPSRLSLKKKPEAPLKPQLSRRLSRSLAYNNLFFGQLAIMFIDFNAHK